MEWVSGSDGPRLFRGRRRGTRIDSMLFRRHGLSLSDQCLDRAREQASSIPLSPSIPSPPHLSVSTSFFVCRKNEKCWGWALLYFRMTDLLQRGGARRIRVGEEQSVPRAQTRALCKGSHGSASVWQLWKFIAIDFVISSLSIGSTRPLWWIARKLFLQSCFF